jgi:hypothetical protein
MSKTRVIAIALVGVALVGLVITFQQGSVPIDLVLSITVDYEGSTIGSLELNYYWKSRTLNFDAEYQEIDWQSESVVASSSPIGQIEQTIVNHMNEATTDEYVPCWMRLNEDGSWEMGLRFLIGSMPVTLSFSGVGPVVDDISISGDINLISPDLKTELQSLGISGLDVTLGWNLVVSRNFLENWAANTFEIFRWAWDGITDIGSRFLGSIDF